MTSTASHPPAWPTSETLWSWSELESGGRGWSEAVDGDRYLRGASLARSFMSDVRLAEDPLLRRQIVIKTVPGAARSPAGKRLLREARITAGLAGPGIVPVLDGGVDQDGQAWFAMPLLDGTSMQVLLDQGASREELLRGLVAAARILSRAHDAGIVHRDLKLENLVLARSGGDARRVYVMDWGIARPASASSDWDAVLSAAEHTAAGQLLGTPGTMSPEQVVAEAIDVRSDVWALGVCLAEILTGKRPFERGSAAETLRAVVAAPIPDVPGRLGEVVRACLQRDPDRRLPHATAFADALDAALEPASTTAPPPAGAAPRHPVRRALPVLLALAALAIGLAAGLGLGQALTSSPSPSNRSLGRLAARTTALDAARHGDLATAELLAASLLMEQEDPFLRGVLAARPPRPTRLSSDPMPACSDQVLSADDTLVACLGPDTTRVLDIATGDVLWRKPIGLANATFVVDRLVGWQPGDSRMRPFHARTGDPQDFRMRWGNQLRFAPSPHPDVLAGIINERAYVGDVTQGERRLLPGQATATEVLPGGGVLTAHHEFLQVYSPDLEPAGPPMARHPVVDEDSPWVTAASADGRYVVEGSLAGTVRTWDLASRRVEQTFLRDGMVRHVAISPDATWVAAVDEGGRAWLWQRGAPTGRIRLPDTTSQVAFPEPDVLALLGRSRTLWRLPAPDSRDLRVLSAGVSDVDWLGDWQAAALGDGHVVRWHVPTGREESQSIVDMRVAKAVSLAPDGRVLAASLEGTPPLQWLFDDSSVPMPHKCRRIVWLEGDLAVCQPMGRGPVVSGRDGRTWPAMDLTQGMVYDTEPLPDRRSAVLIDEFGIVYQVHAGSPPSMERLLDTPERGPVAMDPSGRIYVGRPGAVEVWRRGATEPERLEAPGTVTEVGVSPDGRWVAAGLDSGDVAVWSLPDSALRLVLVGHLERVVGLSFSEDGSRLLTGSWDETVRTWELDVLGQDPAALRAQSERRWGVTAEEHLSP